MVGLDIDLIPLKSDFFCNLFLTTLRTSWRHARTKTTCKPVLIKEQVCTDATLSNTLVLIDARSPYILSKHQYITTFRGLLCLILGSCSWHHPCSEAGWVGSNITLRKPAIAWVLYTARTVASSTMITRAFSRTLYNIHCTKSKYSLWWNRIFINKCKFENLGCFVAISLK